tara:strand:+ start:159 stop:608 length:450 start_codon:yes stop_codon:yes gene_type:complete
MNKSHHEDMDKGNLYTVFRSSLYEVFVSSLQSETMRKGNGAELKECERFFTHENFDGWDRATIDHPHGVGWTNHQSPLRVVEYTADMKRVVISTGKYYWVLKVQPMAQDVADHYHLDADEFLHLELEFDTPFFRKDALQILNGADPDAF